MDPGSLKNNLRNLHKVRDAPLLLFWQSLGAYSTWASGLYPKGGNGLVCAVNRFLIPKVVG